jgi:hypothetical protein
MDTFFVKILPPQQAASLGFYHVVLSSQLGSEYRVLLDRDRLLSLFSRLEIAKNLLRAAVESIDSGVEYDTPPIPIPEDLMTELKRRPEGMTELI